MCATNTHTHTHTHTHGTSVALINNVRMSACVRAHESQGITRLFRITHVCMGMQSGEYMCMYVQESVCIHTCTYAQGPLRVQALRLEPSNQDVLSNYGVHLEMSSNGDVSAAEVSLTRLHML